MGRTRAADFDLYVLDAAGKIVGTSASSADPELVLLPPDSGDYTVRVVPYLPLGESITGKAELTTTPANPPPASFPAPAYQNYAAPRVAADAHDAGEPSIGVNPKTGAVMYQAYMSTFKVGFDTANAATWADRSASATNGCPHSGIKSLDPILFTDRQTGRTFESQLAGKAALTCYTDDDGTTWNTTQGSRHQQRRRPPDHRRRPVQPPGASLGRSAPTRTPSTTARRTSPTRSARSATTAAAPSARPSRCTT